MPSRLQKFLSGYDRSRSREYVLTTKLVHDLSVAAASAGYDLIVYLPTVDADGFDVVFDDRDRLVAMQLKSVVSGGKAATWKIRRSLLRPRPEDADLFGFESSPTGTGRSGGVILISAAAQGDAVSVRYFYTDIVVLSALWEGIVPKPEPQRKRLQKLRHDLMADADGTVKVPRSAFMPAATPAQLLALAGLHSAVDSWWRMRLLDLLRQLNLASKLRQPVDDLRESIRTELMGFGTAAVGTGAAREARSKVRRPR